MAASTSQGDYPLHNSNEPMRLAYQHQIIKDAMNNKLIWAPIDLTKSPLHILDLCTADGTWIRDVQSGIAPNNIKHTFIGTDIEASYFPPTSPENTSYHVQDVQKAWPVDWKGKFDFVHQRLALCCSNGVDSTFETVRKYVELLKPGGYIQLVEMQNWSADVDGPAWKDFTTCVVEMIGSIGSSVTHIDRAKGWFESLGLENVEESVVEANYGTRENKELEKVGKKSGMLTAESILGVVATFPAGVLTIPPERIAQIKPNLEKEMAADSTNAHWHFKVVWGRKPE